MSRHTIRGSFTDIQLLRGPIGWMFRESGGAARGFTLELDFPSLRFLDLAGDGVHGAWIGITTESFSITRHTLRVVQHFSIAADTTEVALVSLALEGFAEASEIAAVFVDMKLHAAVAELALEHSAESATVACRVDFRRAAKAALAAASMAAALAEEVSTAAAVDEDRKAWGIQLAM
jgi:hypothetical protein